MARRTHRPEVVKPVHVLRPANGTAGHGELMAFGTRLHELRSSRLGRGGLKSLKGAVLPQALLPQGQKAVAHVFRTSGGTFGLGDTHELSEAPEPHIGGKGSHSGPFVDFSSIRRRGPLIVVVHGGLVSLFGEMLHRRGSSDARTHELMERYQIGPNRVLREF